MECRNCRSKNVTASELIKHGGLCSSCGNRAATFRLEAKKKVGGFSKSGVALRIVPPFISNLIDEYVEQKLKAG